MDITEPGTSGVQLLTRMDIYNMIQGSSDGCTTKKLEEIEGKLINDSYFDGEKKEAFRRKFATFKHDFKSRWQAANRTKQKFLKSNEQWLQGTLEIPRRRLSSGNTGRPEKSFDDLSERSKRRKTEHLRESHKAPERIRFTKETSEVTKEEIKYFEDQIKDLNTTNFTSAGMEVSVKHTLLFTMIDGKVFNAATDTKSTMRCYLCKLTSTDFNNLDKVKSTEVDMENLKFGLSILHARIRFFESLLHVAYKIPVGKRQIRSQEEKDIVKSKKKENQDKFREELGLLVDISKAGYGNTNDGNTSRRFFECSAEASTITGINEELIKRFATILEVISSGFEINIEKFSSYCDNTAELYVNLYSWHPMTPTVHKVLMHGPLIVKNALLPIGTLSEEVAEVRNKHFRDYREIIRESFPVKTVIGIF